MSDLVKRLRGRAKFLTDLKSVKSPGLLVEAADRIEQLEQELVAEKALADNLHEELIRIGMVMSQSILNYRKARGM